MTNICLPPIELLLYLYHEEIAPCAAAERTLKAPAAGTPLLMQIGG